MFRSLAALSLLLPLVAFAAPAPAVSRQPVKATKIKFATLSADGSVWDKAFERMGAEWKRDTAGRVELHIYAGGVAGDEPDIVRKMRIGQLQAAAMTVSGLGDIEPAFRIFETPLFFRTHAELLYVVEKMTPELSQRLEEKGLVLLNWGHTGWVRLFASKPVRTPDDLRKLKQFVWSGSNDYMTQWWKQNGFKPVPLAATDIPTGLQTGLIEAVPSPPIYALQLQWFRSTPYMMDLGAVPYLGATVITKAAWDKLSAEDQAAMRAACKRAEAYLNEEVPKQEEAAVAEMKKRGLTVTDPSAAAAEWQTLADRFASQVRGGSIPTDVFDHAKSLRDEFRARQ